MGNKLKRLPALLFAGLGVLFFGVAPVLALNTVKEKDSVSYYSTSGNLYAAGSQLTIAEDTQGDVIAIAGTIDIKGDVGRNVRVAGGEVLIDGNVEDDLVVAGGSVIVNGDVVGDVIVFAGEVYVNSKEISGNLLVSGGKVSIDSQTEVFGDKLINTGDKNNRNQGMVNLSAIDNPRDFVNYKSPWRSFSNWKVNTNQTEVNPAIVGVFIVVGFIFWLLTTIGSIIAGVFIIKFFPVYAESTMRTMENKFLPSVLTGIVVMFLSVVLSVLLVISIVGIPLLGVLVLFALVAFMLADVYSKYLFAKIVFKHLGLKTKSVILIFTAGFVFFGVINWLLNLIPIIGGLLSGIINCILISWGLGAIFYNKYQSLSKPAKGK